MDADHPTNGVLFARRSTYLDREEAAVAGRRAVDLADRGGGDRARLEPLKPRPPILAPLRRKNLLQLLRGHVVGVVAKPRHGVTRPFDPFAGSLAA